MAWPDDIAQELPAPRDDEPASLRRDIIDEISDHLHSSLQRELHAARDETTAKHNVLERFGNPAGVARRLWFDAMKEKIMSQRITMIAAIVMAAPSITVAGIAWQLAQRSVEANERMLGILNNVASQQEASLSLDWSELHIGVVIGDENGPPATEHRIVLKSNSNHMPTMEQLTQFGGRVSFGLVRYGSYTVTIFSPSGAQIWQEEFIIGPGSGPISKTIVLPKTEPLLDDAVEPKKP